MNDTNQKEKKISLFYFSLLNNNSNNRKNPMLMEKQKNILSDQRNRHATLIKSERIQISFPSLLTVNHQIAFINFIFLNVQQTFSSFSTILLLTLPMNKNDIKLKT